MLTLPIPPTVNRLHISTANGKRRAPAYVAWREEAGWRINEARAKGLWKPLPEGWYWTDIRLPHSHLGDSDNRIKALHDILHEMGVTPDDKWLLGGTYMRCPDVEPGTIEVQAIALSDPRMSPHDQVKHIAARIAGMAVVEMRGTIA